MLIWVVFLWTQSRCIARGVKIPSTLSLPKSPKRKSRFADHTDRICFFLHKGFSIKILISSQMLVWALTCRQVFWMFISLYFFLALPQSISFLHIIFASKLNFRESFLKQNLRDNHSFFTLYNLFIFISLILQVIL